MCKTLIPLQPVPTGARGAAARVLAASLLLAGCGQQGPLYIPDTPAAQQRATLPQTLFGGARASGTATGAALQRAHRPSGDEVELPPAADRLDSDP